METIFEVTDKTGRRIRLAKEKWAHITIKHPYMTSRLEEIKQTLTRPILIVPHKFDDTRRNYYIYYKHKKRYLLVSVKYLNFRNFHKIEISDSDQKSMIFDMVKVM